MKVFLQNTMNQAYLARHGQWTWVREAARPFASTALAREECVSAHLTDMRLVISYADGDSPYDIQIAIEN